MPAASFRPSDSSGHFFIFSGKCHRPEEETGDIQFPRYRNKKKRREKREKNSKVGRKGRGKKGGRKDTRIEFAKKGGEGRRKERKERFLGFSVLSFSPLASALLGGGEGGENRRLIFVLLVPKLFVIRAIKSRLDCDFASFPSLPYLHHL